MYKRLSIVILVFLGVVFVPYFLIAQSVKHECDSGYSWMPTLSTSSLIIEADICLPDSVCIRLWNEFGENLCGETGSSMWSEKFSYSDSHTWSDSLGCISKEEYRMKVGKKWVKISKCRYYWFNKGATCYSDYPNKIPCCGHKHTKIPD